MSSARRGREFVRRGPGLILAVGVLWAAESYAQQPRLAELSHRIEPVFVDLDAAFASEASEADPGIFMQPNIAPLTLGNFAELRYLMRPITLRAPSSGSPEVTLDVVATGDAGLEVFDTGGGRIALPMTVGVDALPLTVLVNATSTGTAELELRRGAAADSVVVRVGPFPGLAGGELDQYPHFQFVRAINEDSRVQSALDPARHAERIGLAYDAYVLPHHTPPEWAMDNTLVDVTGSMESATVCTGGIEDNILDVWTSGLDGDAGVELGVGYDLVLDFGRDGRLDPGDLIDGLSYEEAGFYVVGDTAAMGPLTFSSFEFDDPGYIIIRAPFDGLPYDVALRSRGIVYFPDPLPTEPAPLVTFAHGRTSVSTSYLGYQYLQRRLASRGYVTASFDLYTAQSTPPDYDFTGAIQIRAWIINKNTERLLTDASLGGGVLIDALDGTRIVSSGHSRGGEAVLIQYHQLLDPQIRPKDANQQPEELIGFDADSIRGLNSIAEVLRNDPLISTPEDVPFLLFYGNADADVSGNAFFRQPPRHYDRAYGDKAVVFLQGVGHGYFNTLWSCICSGPDLWTRTETQAAAAAYLWPFVERVMWGNLPAVDFFSRAPDRFRPIGTQFIPPRKRIITLWRDAEAYTGFVIDDFETNFSPGISSSGQPVTFTVDDLYEGDLIDSDVTGGWSHSEPAGGFWWESRGVIFNWTNTDRFYELAIDPAERDFSDDLYLSFRTCQQPDHPDTDGLGGDCAISVTLAGAGGKTSTISTAAYGVIDPPYLRSGGWGTDFKVFRIRLADFENNGTGIDLRHVQAVRFDVGPSWGSPRGRLGFDDIEITRQ